MHYDKRMYPTYITSITYNIFLEESTEPTYNLHMIIVERVKHTKMIEN